MDPSHDDSPAEDEAALWVVRLHDRDATAADRRAFAAWRAASPENAAAYDALERTWTTLGVVRDTTTHRRIPWLGHARADIVGLAAGVALFGLIGLLLWRAPWAATVYVAGVGETRDIVLKDATRVALNAETRIEVRYTAHARYVRLEQGEALFDVASDRARPFAVETRQAVFTAVGTSFLVRQRARDTRLTVLSGIVEARSRTNNLGAASPPARIAAAGEAVVSATKLSQDALPSAAIDRRLSWRSGRLAFEGETLAEAADAVAAHTGARFVIRDPAVRDLRVGGLVPAKDPEAFAALLRNSLDLDVRRDSDKTYFVTAR